MKQQLHKTMLYKILKSFLLSAFVFEGYSRSTPLGKLRALGVMSLADCCDCPKRKWKAKLVASVKSLTSKHHKSMIVYLNVYICMAY
jgi:hypothetical protein